MKLWVIEGWADMHFPLDFQGFDEVRREIKYKI